MPDGSTALTSTSHSFLLGGGEMGELTRNYNWAESSVGTPDRWPQSLRTTLGILLHSRFPMFLFWGEELICFYNDAYRPSLGSDGKHPFALGKPAEKVWPEIWKDIKPLIDQVINTGEATWDEDRLLPIFRNGQMEDVYWTFSYSAVIDEEGRPAGVFVTCTETTEKVNQTSALYKSEQNLRNMILQAPAAMCILRGPNHVMEIANEKMFELWGKKEHELTGRPIFEVLHEASGQGFEALLDHVYETGQSYNGYEFPVTLPRDGGLKTAYINFVYEAFHDADGAISGIMAMGNDVTEQVLARKRIEESETELKKSAEELKNSNEQLQLAMDAGELGMFEVDFVKNEVYPSARFSEIFNIPVSNNRQDYADVLHPDDSKLREIAHRKAARTGVLEYTTRLIWKNQEVHWIAIKGMLTFDEHRRPAKMLGVIQDITGQKELEFQKDNFLGVASHELKTPVTSIKVYVQVMEDLLRKSGETQYADMMGRIDKQVNRLNYLIADLLDVTKINSGKLQFNITTFSFAELVNEVVEDMQRIAPKHTIHKHLSFDGLITTDRERTSQIMINLISNAIKYSPNADTINVFVTFENDEIITSVQDFGIGIKGDKTERVFEQFYRVSGTKEHTFPGLGLGLYISSEIVKRMGGRIWVNSTVDKGSTFYFALPLKDKQFLLGENS
jgi:two-component system, OmpR family, sensor histidine kinase VicK